MADVAALQVVSRIEEHLRRGGGVVRALRNLLESADASLPEGEAGSLRLAERDVDAAIDWLAEAHRRIRGEVEKADK